MKIVIVLLSFILAWFFIEMILLISNTIIQEKKRKIINNKFAWYLRVISLSLLLVSFLYIRYTQNISLKEAIQYCLGIIR